jgi:hypothetical protein
MPDPADHVPAWVQHDDGRWYPGARRSGRRADDGTWIATADYHAPIPEAEAGGIDGLTGHYYRQVPADRIRPRSPDDPHTPGQGRLPD